MVLTVTLVAQCEYEVINDCFNLLKPSGNFTYDQV
jgi:hypothetical protein